jgi:hypothetical protein
MPEGADGGGNAFAAALATTIIGNMRFQYSEDGTFTSFMAGETTSGRWSADDGVLRLVNAEGAANEARYAFEDGHFMLTNNPETTLCLRHETEAEAQAVQAALEAAAAEAERAAAAAQQREAQLAAARALASVELRGVTVTPANFQQGRISDRLVFQVRLTNTTSQAINAIRGKLIFVNSFGEAAGTLTVTHEQPTAAGVVSDLQFELDFNQFMAEHQVFRSFQPGQTQVRWEPMDIVLADGTRVSAPE